MPKLKVLKYIHARGKNKRITMALMEEEETGEKCFRMTTKILANFKTRNIISTDGIYSVETFAVMNSLMTALMDDPEVRNKLIHKELSKITPFNAQRNF